MNSRKTAPFLHALNACPLSRQCRTHSCSALCICMTAEATGPSGANSVAHCDFASVMKRGIWNLTIHRNFDPGPHQSVDLIGTRLASDHLGNIPIAKAITQTSRRASAAGLTNFPQDQRTTRRRAGCREAPDSFKHWCHPPCYLKSSFPERRS